MKNIVTAKDMALMGKIFKFTSPETLPLSFVYDGKKVVGLPADYCPKTERILSDTNMTVFLITGQNADGLQVKVEVREYRDYPMMEFTAFFTNTGAQDTRTVSDIRIIDGVIAGDEPLLIHGNGDTCGEDGYEWFRDPLSPDANVYLRTNDGTSCNGAFPYMRLMFEGWGVNIAVGWPAMWMADFTGVENGAGVKIGQRRCSFVIRPGETMRTPRVNLEAFTGDEVRGMQMWRRWYFDHMQPRENGRPVPPKYILHVFQADGKPEFTGASEENQVGGITEYLRRGVKPDLWWIDAGWYPCDYDWPKIGTWRPDEKRFPNGLAPIGKACADNHIGFLLWFEPERVREGTELALTHPEWLLHGGGDALLNLGDPACCDYIIELVNGLIKESGVTVYRQDFNMNPEPAWTQNETEDRIGAMENLHVQGYLRYWDTIIERNPGLWIDSCASGGRRNDPETMRRAVTLHYTDVGYGNHPIKQKQHRQMFEWLPYFRAHNMNWDHPETGEYNTSRPQDRFSYHCAMTPAITDMLLYNDTDEAFRLAREMKPIWKKAAEIMLDADYYPLTECRKSREDMYAMQFHNPDKEAGFVQAIRNNACPTETYTAYLKALDPRVTYRLVNPETRETYTLSGDELSRGFRMKLALRSGQIWFYHKI